MPNRVLFGSILSFYLLDHHHVSVLPSPSFSTPSDQTLYNGGEFDRFQSILTTNNFNQTMNVSSSSDLYSILSRTVRYIGPQRALLYLFTSSGNLSFNNEDVYGLLQAHPIEVKSH